MTQHFHRLHFLALHRSLTLYASFSPCLSDEFSGSSFFSIFLRFGIFRKLGLTACQTSLFRKGLLWNNACHSIWYLPRIRRVISIVSQMVKGLRETRKSRMLHITSSPTEQALVQVFLDHFSKVPKGQTALENLMWGLRS